MTPRDRVPLRRRQLLAGAVVLLAVVTGVVSLAEILRHPPVLPSDDVPAAEDDGDPRVEVTCPTALPREGEAEGPAPDTSDVPAPGQLVSSNDLYDCPRLYDGRQVRYRGEVIGALLERPGGAWTQLNDDLYADALGPLPAHRDFRGGNAGVGAWLPADLVEEITWVGGPAARGDVVEVVATYRRVDEMSGEIAVLRVESGEIVRAGEPIEHPALRDRQVAGALLSVLALATVAAHLRRSGRLLRRHGLVG